MTIITFYQKLRPFYNNPSRDAHNYYAWTKLKFLTPFMIIKSYCLQYIAFANSVNLKKTHIPGARRPGTGVLI